MSTESDLPTDPPKAYRYVGEWVVLNQELVVRQRGVEVARPSCDHCDDSGRSLYFGSGPTADLIACPVCDHGRKLGDTDIPTVQQRRSVEAYEDGGA